MTLFAVCSSDGCFSRTICEKNTKKCKMRLGSLYVRKMKCNYEQMTNRKREEAASQETASLAFCYECFVYGCFLKSTCLYSAISIW